MDKNNISIFIKNQHRAMIVELLKEKSPQLKIIADVKNLMAQWSEKFNQDCDLFADMTDIELEKKDNDVKLKRFLNDVSVIRGHFARVKKCLENRLKGVKKSRKKDPDEDDIKNEIESDNDINTKPSYSPTMDPRREETPGGDDDFIKKREREKIDNPVEEKITPKITPQI